MIKKKSKFSKMDGSTRILYVFIPRFQNDIFSHKNILKKFESITRTILIYLIQKKISRVHLFFF